MLSYRHSFHAGNAADVLKHMVFAWCAGYLTKKEKPLLCVDTHAGAGLYKLGGQNREWEGGFGRLKAAASGGRRIPAMAAFYLELAAASEGLYPGSPVIAAKLLRPRDRLVCFELHPADYELLKENLERLKLPGSGKGAPGIESLKADGPASLKSLLPPPSRRGLILVDPSWEEKNEFQTIPAALAEALRRFPQGTYIIWYPLLLMPKDTIKDAPEAEHSGTLPETLLKLFPAGNCCIEFHTAPRSSAAFFPHTGTSPRGMYGSGLVVYNPPWTLKAALEEALPFLAEVLGSGDWRLEWK